jgi:uncharacterized membrane protein
VRAVSASIMTAGDAVGEATAGAERFAAEEVLAQVVQLLVVVVEACGAIVIIIGAVWAFVRFVAVGFRSRSAADFVPVRLTLGRFLALGLEFQLASDILSTAVAPTWEELGKLAAVAAIRTALNYFLSREIKEERRQVEEDQTEGRLSEGTTTTARP